MQRAKSDRYTICDYGPVVRYLCESSGSVRRRRSAFCAPCLIVHLLCKRKPLLDQLRDSGAVEGDLVPLEPFGISHGRDIRTREVPARSQRGRRKLATKKSSLIVPEAVVHHAKRTGGVLIVVRKATRIEELDHS